MLGADRCSEERKEKGRAGRRFGEREEAGEVDRGGMRLAPAFWPGSQWERRVKRKWPEMGRGTWGCRGGPGQIWQDLDVWLGSSDVRGPGVEREGSSRSYTK